jgi:hypothetical protein
MVDVPTPSPTNENPATPAPADIENKSVVDDDPSLLGAAPDANKTDETDGGDKTADPASTETKSGERPENVPEAFWKDGALDTEALLADYKAKSEIADKYVAPETYEVHIPEGIPESFMPGDDPLIVSAHEWGKKWNLPQEALDEAIGMVVGVQFGIVEEHKKDQIQKLGPDADKVVGRVEKFLSGNLSPVEYEIARRFAVTSEGIMVLDKIRSMALSESKINITPSSSVSKGLTQAEADAIMKKDEYWDEHHPEYKTLRDKVTKFYQGSK